MRLAAFLLTVVLAITSAVAQPAARGPAASAPAVRYGAAASGQVLYNGIVLPKEWPPKLDFDKDIKTRKPLPVPYYLQHPPAVIPIDLGRQLFVDDFLIESATLTRSYHLAEYYPQNPVVSDGMVFSGGVFVDPKDQLFKMWYFAGGGVAYTTSKDGIHWGKYQVVQPGSSDSTTVWLDQETADPASRFKMIRSITANKRTTGHIFISPDGIHWTDTGKQTGDWGDRSTFFYNPFRKVWVYSSRHGWGEPRARRYWEAPDLVEGFHWKLPEVRPPIWVGADELDPPREDYKIAPQLYNLDCAGYESLLLGLFTIWRGQPGPREKPNEVCVGFSRDGWSWSRPDRRAFCPVSETPGQWNYANVQSAGGCCLIVGDKLYFYVSGRGKGHATGLATLRRDGFASMDAGSTEGALTTRPLRFSGKRLFVNADVPQGELSVEMLDAAGEVIAPFTRGNCQKFKGDSTIAAVQWNGAKDLSALDGKPVRFRFHLKNGRLYAFWVSPDASGAGGGYVAAGGPGFTGPTDTVGVRAYKAAK